MRKIRKLSTSRERENIDSRHKIQKIEEDWINFKKLTEIDSPQKTAKKISYDKFSSTKTVKLSETSITPKHLLFSQAKAIV